MPKTLSSVLLKVTLALCFLYYHSTSGIAPIEGKKVKSSSTSLHHLRNNNNELDVSPAVSSITASARVLSLSNTSNSRRYRRIRKRFMIAKQRDNLLQRLLSSNRIQQRKAINMDNGSNNAINENKTKMSDEEYKRHLIMERVKQSRQQQKQKQQQQQRGLQQSSTASPAITMTGEPASAPTTTALSGWTDENTCESILTITYESSYEREMGACTCRRLTESEESTTIDSDGVQVNETIPGNFYVECIYDYCQECSTTANMCGELFANYTYIENIDKPRFPIPKNGSECIQYTNELNKNDIVCITTVAKITEGSSKIDYECQIQLNDQLCSSCSLQVCDETKPDSNVELIFDCTNVDNGYELNACDYSPYVANKPLPAIQPNDPLVYFYPSETKIFGFDTCYNASSLAQSLSPTKTPAAPNQPTGPSPPLSSSSSSSSTLLFQRYTTTSSTSYTMLLHFAVVLGSVITLHYYYY